MLAAFFDQELLDQYANAVTPVTALVAVTAIGGALWLVFQLRARFREDTGRADGKLELLSQFRELHQQGELSEDEYRLIKSRLAREAVAASGPPERHLNPAHSAKAVRQDEGNENTGESGGDDGKVDESSTTDEPPNENSTDQ